MCLYVLLFANGTIKIGRSGSVRSRAHSLRLQLNGQRVISAAWSPRLEFTGGAAEKWLLERMRRMAVSHKHGKEFFVGVAFRQALTLLRQAYRKHANNSSATGWRIADGIVPFGRQEPRRQSRRASRQETTAMTTEPGEIDLSRVRLVQTSEGDIAAHHVALKEPVSIPRAALLSWLRRQLRETVV